MKKREDFEAWTRKFYGDLACASDTWSDEKGTYTEYAHHMAWHLWQDMQSRLQSLEKELVQEAKRTAEQKLRADQMTKQHAMQARMHAESNERIVSLEKDAERYREYKENSYIRFSLFSGRYRADNGFSLLTDWTESFDECFDTAMQANKS